MADAAVSMLVDALIPTIEQWLKDEISLVTGVRKELASVSSKLQRIGSVVDDAEKRSVQDEFVKGWLEEVKDISYEMDDVVDEWNTAISTRKFEEVENNQISCSSLFTCFPCNQVCLRHEIALKIKDINARLDSVITEINGFSFVLNSLPIRRSSVEYMESKLLTTSIVNESETYGRDSDKTTLLSKLLSESSSRETNRNISVISIVGVGGLGKTTLAKLVYNNDEVVRSFSKRIWVCASNPFDVFGTAKEIVDAIIGENLPNDLSPDRLLMHLKASISNEKFLLVLDDVWDEERKKWEDLRSCLDDGAAGSRILVTTRKETVAKAMGTSSTNLYHLGILSEEACWSLFSQIAFDYEKEDTEMLKEIGREIVKKCKGLPLAVRVLGCLLCNKKTEEEWEHVLHNEIWKLEKAEVDLFPHLYLSYNELPPALKRCFSYCSIFPKDTYILVDELIRTWMAQGYITSDGEYDMELKGHEYFEKLSMCCFFQDFGKDRLEMTYKCKMHDIVHDFAKYLKRKECITIANEIPNTCSGNTRHLALLPSPETNSPYLTIGGMEKLRTFFTKEHSLGQPNALFNHLKRVRVLVLANCGLKKLPKKVGSLVHLRYLDLSNNKDLGELPESVCELYNLQTLDIEYCQSLSRLPEMIGKLRNLRYLFIYSVPLREYPKSFEKLINLRILDTFTVGRKFGKLEYLEHFKHLREYLQIKFEDDLEEAQIIADAKKAQLKNKKYIQQLLLKFSNKKVGTEAVWEALEPPPKVHTLITKGIFGTKWPSWLTKSLNNLKVLVIDRFPDCSTLPPLGKLSCLEKLEIRWNTGIKRIGQEFLGIEEDTIAPGDSRLRRGPMPSSSSVVCAFPKLVKLSFEKLDGWEEWEDLNDEDDEEETTTTTTTTSSSIQIMPQLRKLSLFRCPKLKQIPGRLLRKASSLKCLSITNCGIFPKYDTDTKEKYDNDTEESSFPQMEQLLSHIPKVLVDGITYASR